MADETQERLPEITDDVVYSRVSEGGVLLSTETEVYYGLNETGARIWESLASCETMDGLCRRLESEYPEVDPATLRRDVEELLEDLTDHGLLVRRPNGGRHEGDG